MPIDLQTEELLSLTDAAKALPRIDGRRPHASSIWRWARYGVRGVKLDYVRLGHRVCTSREALWRFAQRLAEADDPATQGATVPGASPSPQVAPGQDLHDAEADLARCYGSHYVTPKPHF